MSEAPDIGTGLTAAEVNKLRDYCLTLVRAWQPLATQGWNAVAARRVLDEIDAICIASEQNGWDSLQDRALELSAYLSSFVDDTLVPSQAHMDKLTALVSALGSALSGLTPLRSAKVTTLPSRPTPIPVSRQTPPNAGEPRDHPQSSAKVVSIAPPAAEPRTFAPRTLAMLAVDETVAPGLESALRERGFELQSFTSTADFRYYLERRVPAAVLAEARHLRTISQHSQLLNPGSSEAGLSRPALLILSSRRDLSQRLLAMRVGANAFFSAPVDGLKVVSKLEELLETSSGPAYRVLVVDPDRQHATTCASWLADRGMTVRLASNAESAFAALQEFRPEVVLIDLELGKVSGLELTSLIRQQSDFATTPIVLTSSAHDLDKRFDAVAAGADEFLIKPLRARHLASAVVSRARRAELFRAHAQMVRGQTSGDRLVSRSELIDRLRAACGDRSAAILYVKLDHSASLTERIGLTQLPALEQAIAPKLIGELEAGDVIGQYQDFTYLVILHRARQADCTTASERLRSAIAEAEILVGGHSIRLSVSIGAAVLGGDGGNPVDADHVLANAQAACLAAGHLGGDRVLWYQPRELALIPSDPMVAIRAMLSRALDDERVVCTVQPIVPLTGKLTGQYALVPRIKTGVPGQAAVGYREFMPIATELGVAVAVDRLLLNRALAMRGDQLHRGRQLRLFLQQSIDGLLDTDLIDWLGVELKQRHLSGTGLTLEYDCTQVIDRRERAMSQFEKLHKMGVRIGLTGFGRDWAAVHVLKSLPIDFLRLAPDLVESVTLGRGVSEMLGTLVRKAHEFSAAVIAPEIDNMAKGHLLTGMGVDYGQGKGLGMETSEPAFDFTRSLR